MQHLTPIAPTMTSLELVEFINADRKQRAKAAGEEFPSKGFAELAHADFLKKVPDVLGGGAGNFSDTYRHPQNGQWYPMYRFPKREACLMAMSYSYELQAKVFDRMTAIEGAHAANAQQFAIPAPATPLDVKEQAAALKAILADDELKRLAPLLWQDICDGAQNAMRRFVGATLALPAPETPKLLDVVEIAKAHGIELPSNLRGAAGKYVKARVQSVETERLINGSIRKSSAYADHAAVADALREYLAKRAA